MLTARQLAGTACCYWSFCCRITPHDSFISFLQDIMPNIIMWVTIYDPFASNLGTDDYWNRLDYPWLFIKPLLFFLYVESLLWKPKSSVFSYTDCIQIVIQQTRTAGSEVLHTTSPNRPLTSRQNTKTTGYQDNMVSIWLVCRIRRLIFIQYQQQTQFEPM